MFGKTYSNGHEPNLEHALLHKPVNAALGKTVTKKSEKEDCGTPKDDEDHGSDGSAVMVSPAKKDTAATASKDSKDVAGDESNQNAAEGKDTLQESNSARYAIWYPLRRSGKFYMEDPADRCNMLLEHAVIGRAFGDLGLAHDIRLQSYGLDEKDNEFVIGIVGEELHPLSRVIQDMRMTDHTSRFMDSLGPFFVGLKVRQWRGGEGGNSGSVGASS